MKTLAYILAGLVLAWLVFDGAWRFMLTGRFFPIHIVEQLSEPVAVRGWSGSGLALGDGRRVMPKGMLALPAESKALATFTEKGVEVSPDGTVYGLVEVHHGCGNDPVTLEIRRIDIGKALTFLRVGKSAHPPTKRDYHPLQPGGSIGKWGWNGLEANWYMRFVRGEQDPMWDIREANESKAAGIKP